jgi:hypothetical protein
VKGAKIINTLASRFVIKLQSGSIISGGKKDKASAWSEGKPSGINKLYAKLSLRKEPVSKVKKRACLIQLISAE